MQVHHFMKQQVISIYAEATALEAAVLFARHRVGTLPVVTSDQKLIGILYMRDLLKLMMPGFVELIEDFDFVVGDFGDYEEQEPTAEIENRPIQELMETAVSVTADSGLLRAFALIVSHKLTDLPVVDDDGRLVGLASHVDIGSALLARWQGPHPQIN